MEQNKEYRDQLVEKYKNEAMPLLRFIPWLEKYSGTSMSTAYSNSEIDGNTMAFPVYDSTLMNFVKEAAKSPMMDKNYRYVYTRNRIFTHDDERRIIEKATLTEWNILCGILSKYVLGGRTKGTLWNEAVKEDIFYLVLNQMRTIIEFWDKPLDIRY